jgi:hypothetical protein
MSDIVFTCPACLTAQALVPNLLAPGPDESVWVCCPDCGADRIKHTPARNRRVLREWAAMSVEVDCSIFRGQLDRWVVAIGDDL